MHPSTNFHNKKTILIKHQSNKPNAAEKEDKKHTWLTALCVCSRQTMTAGSPMCPHLVNPAPQQVAGGAYLLRSMGVLCQFNPSSPCPETGNLSEGGNCPSGKVQLWEVLTKTIQHLHTTTAPMMLLAVVRGESFSEAGVKPIYVHNLDMPLQH